MAEENRRANRMPGFSHRQFVREFTGAMDDSRAALFLGAGASIEAGFIDWRSLLKGIAEDLDLDIDRVSDLLSLAQYDVNVRGGRHRINQAILEEFDRLAKYTPAYDALVRLPITEIWTTNYDRVCEDSYTSAGQSVDVKVNPTSVNVAKPGRDVVIYKMHGDVRDPDDAIITRDDYERYRESERGRPFLNLLTAALTSRTFLFLGFSFSDPNIAHILTHLRLTFGQSRPEHYAVLRRPDWPDDIEDPSKRAEAQYIWRSTELQIEDLKRFGVHVVLVDEYSDIAPLLQKLVRSSRRNYVFVSGAVHDAGEFGYERLMELGRMLGERLAETDKHLISGLGVEIGQQVVFGFFQAGFCDKAENVGERAMLRPFPQHAPGGETSLAAFWRAYRKDMLQHAGFAIYLAGNKLDRSMGNVVLSSGMFEEFDIACDFGTVPIPIGATGLVARELWQRVMENPPRYYGDNADRIMQELETLNDASKNNIELIEAVFRIMETVTRSY